MIKIKCPYCGDSETKVIDSRESEESTRRRRECLSCEKRFTTHERVENITLNVIKKDGRIESFDREKVKRGMLISGQKRIEPEIIENITEDIEYKLKNMDTTDVPSKIIGQEVMKQLKKKDKVAYIRFASIYRDFADVQEFQEELKKLTRKR